MKKVLITDIAWPDIALEQSILAKADAKVVLAPDTSETTLAELAHDCTAIMTCWAKTTAAVIRECEDCRIVARFGIGLDNIDVPYCTEHGIPVTNVPDYCVGEVADHTLALILTMARKTAFFDSKIKCGQYNLQAGYPLQRIAGKTLGIVGFGRIGRAVARRAQAFGIQVIVHTRNLGPVGAAELGVKPVPLEVLLQHSDYISLHLPLTSETEGLLDARRLAGMKEGAFLINTSRGALLDHDALLMALNDGPIRGAALDVSSPEPLPSDSPLVTHERVIHTPHAAFYSAESVDELRRRTAQEVVRALKGEPLHNRVN